MKLLKKNRAASTNGHSRLAFIFNGEGMTAEMASALLAHEKSRVEISSMGMMASDSDLNFGYPNGNGSFNGINNRMGNASLDHLQTSALPKSKEDRIKRAFSWYEEDDFLGPLVDLKQKFCVMGFDLRATQENNSELAAMLKGLESKNPIPPPDDPTELKPAKKIVNMTPEDRKSLLEQAKFQAYLNKVKRKWNLRWVIKDMIRDWIVSDSMILYWRIDDKVSRGKSAEDSVPPEPDSKESLIPGLVDLCALDPRECEWINIGGVDVLKYHIPADIKLKIKAALDEVRRLQSQLPIQRLMEEESIPMRWIQAVKDGKDWVILSNEDGDYWIVKTDGRKQHGLSWPSMYKIFLFLENRKAVKEGDFATAFMMKHFILHVTAGESIQAGNLAGLQNNWATPSDIDAIFLKIIEATKTARMVTNHTVKFNFVFPPKEMWDVAKYEKAEMAILLWIGVTLVVATGEGGTNSSGYIGTKQIVASMSDTRSEVNSTITEFFDHPSIKSRLESVPEGVIVSAAFDENALKEGRQLLDEIKTLLKEGYIDPRTTLKELGRDPDSIRVNKLQSQFENERTGVYAPLNHTEQMPFGQGFEDQDAGGPEGRPAKPGTTRDADTRNQPPLLK